MTDKKNFRKQFWTNKRMVGAMAPSSKYLSKKMLSSIDFDNAKVIVELGPGTGVFTDEIILRMRPDATLLAFELNDLFYENLAARTSDKRVHIIHDSADQVERYLAEHNLSQADAVISSLPLAVFSEELRNAVITNAHNCLSPEGKFIQFQYSLQSKKLLKSVYKQVKIGFTALNLPPAFIYSCNK